MWNCKTAPNEYNPPVAGCQKNIRLKDGVNIGRVIGKGGKVFNAITENTVGVKYIWYRNDTREIEVYGDSMESIIIAINKIENRMRFVADK